MVECVKTHNLVKIYHGDVNALKNVNLSVKRGELFTLLGPNGAGKTTFLRIVSTQLVPTHGDAYVMEHSALNEPDEVREHIAVVPQDVVPMDFFTPWEYAYYFAMLRGMPSRDAKRAAKKALKIVDLWKLKGKICMDLSGGEKKRTIVASALASETDVLMLDEPTSGLDVLARRRVWAALREIVKEGKTVILTTHMMDEAEIVSDRLAIINLGRVVAEGTLDSIKRLVKEKFRVSVDARFSGLSAYGKVAKVGDRLIVYVKSESEALELVEKVLKAGMRAEAAPITLEDIFIRFCEAPI
jgi:ABC-2 type transport system ATP-binding protein